VAALAPDCEKKPTRKWQKCDVFFMQQLEFTNDFNSMAASRKNRILSIFERNLLESHSILQRNIIYLMDA
jgi:hypothetical protein